MIPDHDSSPDKLEIFSRAKRQKQSSANLVLSPRKGMLPDHENVKQSQLNPLVMHAVG